jgi:hypothetical protein
MIYFWVLWLICFVPHLYVRGPNSKSLEYAPPNGIMILHMLSLYQYFSCKTNKKSESLLLVLFFDRKFTHYSRALTYTISVHHILACLTYDAYQVVRKCLFPILTRALPSRIPLYNSKLIQSHFAFAGFNIYAVIVDCWIIWIFFNVYLFFTLFLLILFRHIRHSLFTFPFSTYFYFYPQSTS